MHGQQNIKKKHFINILPCASRTPKRSFIFRFWD